MAMLSLHVDKMMICHISCSSSTKMLLRGCEMQSSFLFVGAWAKAIISSAGEALGGSCLVEFYSISSKYNLLPPLLPLIYWSWASPELSRHKSDKVLSSRYSLQLGGPPCVAVTNFTNFSTRLKWKLQGELKLIKNIDLLKKSCGWKL